MSFYLIDFENVGEAGFHGVENLKKGDKIIAFYSEKTCKKFSIEILGSITRQGARIDWKKADVGTKNALDFQLSSHVGFLAAKIIDNIKSSEHRFFSDDTSKNTVQKEPVFIISKDNGYSPLVSYWKQYDITVHLAVDLSGTVVPATDRKKKAKAEEATEKKLSEIQSSLSVFFADAGKDEKNDSEKQDEKKKADIEKAVSEVLKKKNKNKDKIEEIVGIVLSSKTKSELNSKLEKLLKDGKKVSEIIKSVKPFVKLK